MDIDESEDESTELPHIEVTATPRPAPTPTPVLHSKQDSTIELSSYCSQIQLYFFQGHTWAVPRKGPKASVITC